MAARAGILEQWGRMRPRRLQVPSAVGPCILRQMRLRGPDLALCRHVAGAARGGEDAGGARRAAGQGGARCGRGPGGARGKTALGNTTAQLMALTPDHRPALGTGPSWRRPSPRLCTCVVGGLEVDRPESGEGNSGVDVQRPSLPAHLPPSLPQHANVVSTYSAKVVPLAAVGTTAPIALDAPDADAAQVRCAAPVGMLPGPPPS